MLLTKLLSLITLCITLFYTGKPKLYKMLDYCTCSHILNRDVSEGICSPIWEKILSKSLKMGSGFPFCLDPVPYWTGVAEDKLVTAEDISLFFWGVVLPSRDLCQDNGIHIFPSLSFAQAIRNF